MFYYLRGGLNLGTSTKCLVTLLITYTLTTGLVMSVVSLTALAIFSTEATRAYLPLVHFMISNIYVNSYLAGLNWRVGLRNLGQGSGSLSMQSSLSLQNEITQATLLCAVSRLVMAILHPRKFSVESSAAV
ncbi:hypothetical protein BDN71DRAFT_567990 [Pleurotus eryngii]|uniref:DUF6534 domain-containing protein n=1 Tax=Pleurotus eryngii TaxID=5323 RepID=A0A9P5ZJV5_PLEER|nr:hypothetical protein BDN71DRAFT_567990 [Pleurotus eryngii]